MRPIDADLLMENLGFDDTEEEREENVGEIITWEDVDSLPTAFDVEKVIEQLNKELELADEEKRRCTIEKCCNLMKQKVMREEWRVLQRLLSEVEEMKNKEQTNACYGCFGAANGDCDECDKNRSDKDEK